MNNTNKARLCWATISKKVNDLIPQELNPRKINDKQMSELKRSLKKFNLAEIPAIDLDGKILAGHQRVKALQLLGRGEELIDIRVPNRKLTDEESEEYLLASNKLGGEWDFDLLKSFDMDILEFAGFDKIELSKEWDSLPASKTEEFNVNAEIKNIHNPKTKLGDIISLGEHRLICGDSTCKETVKKLMNGNKASLINTDTPYNQKLDYNKGVGGNNSKKNYGGDVNDSLPDEVYKEFVRKIMENALDSSHEDVHAFFWCSDYYIWVFQTNYLELGLQNKRVLSWVKNNASPTPSVAFNRATESCCYAVRGKPYLNDTINNLNEIQNENIGTGNDLLENLHNLLLVKRLPTNKYQHPTEKNPEVHHSLLKRCSAHKDIVLDLTAGSGSILTSCHEIGRIAYMCEMNPIFCDVIVKRYESLTGMKAVYEN